ncbi:MAG: AAA family ATPase, partial [Spirochaetaceae bacterium]|nr:AAA family ATPase [Spirochaetaceae bacterium]
METVKTIVSERTAQAPYTGEIEERIRICREKKGTILDLSGIGIDRIPEEVKTLKNLCYLNVCENNLTEVPDFIGSFSRLQYLNLSFNRIKALPETIGELWALKTLDVRSNNISALPEAIGRIGALEFLDLSYNKLSALPQAIENLSALERCEIRGNSLCYVPEKIALLAKPQQLNLLGHIEKIVDTLDRTGFSAASLANMRQHSEYLAQKLHITPLQGVLFSGILCAENGMSLEGFARSAECSKIRILQYTEDFNALRNKGLIRRGKNDFENTIFYKVPKEIREFLFKDEEYLPPPETRGNLTLDELFVHLWKLFNRRVGKKEISYGELGMELKTLLDENSHLSFVKKIENYSLSSDDLIMLLRFCSYLVNLDASEMDFNELEAVYDGSSNFFFLRKELIRGNHVLLVKGLIENAQGDGFRNAESFRLTEKAKRELLAEVKLSSILKEKDITAAAKIQEKTLFYNDREAEQVRRVTSLLGKDSLREVQERLAEGGMRTGFACLFWGPPGTGKTETVYQIARRTGRDIMMVDIAQTKSMWFGESEKIIKEIFSRYRSCVEESGLTPILLINEADAVISKRRNLTSNRNGPGQTENAIQNIILQEM